MFPILRNHNLQAVLTGLLVAAPLAAQGGGTAAAAAAPTGPVCDVEQMQPQQLALASIGRQKVIAAKSPDDGMKNIRDGMKQVFDKATAANMLGRDYLAAQFMLLAVEFGGEKQTRGNLNMPGDKAATIDLLVTADSLLALVEAAKPACHEEISQWREYKPYANRIQAAYAALSANNLDSAISSANRALIMSKSAPQAYDVLWRAAAAKNDEENQVKFLKIAVEKLATDTANAKIRSNLMFNLGRIQQGFAEKAPADKKAALWKGATDAYIQVVKEHPGSQEAPFAINGVGNHWALTQDTIASAAVLVAVKPVMGKLTDMALAQAAVIAVRLQHNAEAGELFKAATTANPYQREYLYNYSATLLQLNRHAEMVPVVHKLLSLDPSNPDNVLMLAYAYKGMADATTDAPMKKAYTDSAVAYSTKSDGMKHKVEIKNFDRGEAVTTLDVEIENRDRAAKSFNVDVEFLDKTGTVIEKKSVTVGPVAPNAIGAGKVEISKGGAAGFRYAPLPYDPTPLPVAAPEPAQKEPALTTKDVTTLLSAKVANEKLLDMAGTRGCKITWTAATTAELKKAGATDASIAQLKAKCAAAKP
jgi:tetratricopeptide (TPR) repeat protein